MVDETSKPIEKIEIDDMILARPHDNPTGPLQKCRVVRVFKNEPQSTWKLTFDSGLTVQATKEHPFFVNDKGWTQAEDLRVGDLCVNVDGKTVALTSKEFVEDKQPVYNFEVEQAHTYYVGESEGENVLVHNTCLYTGEPMCFHVRCRARYFPSPVLPVGAIFDPLWDIPAIFSNSRGVGHGRISSAFIAGGTGLATAVGVTGVTTIYDPTDPVTGNPMSKDEALAEYISGAASLTTTAVGLRSVVKLPGKAVTSKAIASTPKPKQWGSADPGVASTANAIEAKYPGKVLDVNAEVMNKNGVGLAGEFDILLDDAIIQVKSGNARGLVKQMEGTTVEALDAAGMSGYRVFGYVPDASDSYMRTQQYHGHSITNNINQLLKWIGGE